MEESTKQKILDIHKTTINNTIRFALIDFIKKPLSKEKIEVRKNTIWEGTQEYGMRFGYSETRISNEHLEGVLRKEYHLV